MKTQQLATILLAAFTTASLAAVAGDTTNAPPAAAKPAQPAATPAGAEPTPTNGFALNFHDVPLNAVLTYLSAKAGLIVVSDVNLQGKVSVVAEQPITTNDIVGLLNDQLGKNNYSAILQGRTLTIMDSERAKTYAATPVKIANGYTNIPMDDQTVTEILPLHTLVATQLIKDLESLMPHGATVTANEAGNSVIMTAQQKDVRRIAEIINALDGSALSEVEVFALRYADSKSVADELKEVFQTGDSDITRANTRNSFQRRGGGGGPFGGGGGGGGSSTEDASKNVQTHAVFVADDQMNAVIASAPPDYMRMITNVIAMLDKPSQEVTVMRVFHLKHADPGEISDELTTMFPSNTSTDQNNRTMGMRFMPPWMQQQRSSTDSQSPRMKRELTVTTVADRRTQSVIVTASREMMEQIDGVIKDLDQGTQGVQKVTALDFGGADPAAVEETMSGLFSSANSRTPTSTQTATPLGNRYQGNANSQSTTTTTSSSTGSVGSTGTSALH